MQKDLLHLFPLMSPSQSVKRGKAGSSTRSRDGWKDKTCSAKKQTKKNRQTNWEAEWAFKLGGLLQCNIIFKKNKKNIWNFYKLKTTFNFSLIADQFLWSFGTRLNQPNYLSTLCSQSELALISTIFAINKNTEFIYSFQNRERAATFVILSETEQRGLNFPFMFLNY